MAEHSPPPEHIRQSLLNDLNERKKVVTELSDEELEEVAGGKNSLANLFFSGGMVLGTAGAALTGYTVHKVHEVDKTLPKIDPSQQ